MRKSGVTLLELVVSMAIMSIVAVVLVMFAQSLAQASQVQEAKVRAHDESRLGLMVMSREIRQAARSTVNWGALPGQTLTFQIAQDLDGNGYGVDVSGNLELSAQRSIGPDTTDANNDGRTTDQLILNDGVRVIVLANGLAQNEDANANGALDAGEDLNNNGRLERGIWFAVQGTGIQVTIDAERMWSPQGGFLQSSLTRILTPRN
jgi:prepilin-type N-terminal cleavage/methylation domain-containing protein